ncbi:MAG TPA: hypothetical protein VFV34_26235, partial [Blastocatellia bacterium]|nr:hypothetical protein [Blastocatellia bacterium]
MNPFPELIDSLKSPTERRLVKEYGAVLVTRAIAPPSILFRGESEVQAFQSSVDIARARLGEHEIELQRPAMEALLSAATEAGTSGRAITPRAPDSGRRSYQDTVSLWNRNVSRGLDHWEASGRLDSTRAERIRKSSPADQVDLVLEIEEKEALYFGTFFDRSILYSVAAPGSSQHLTMLAFDVAEHSDESVEKILRDWGWYRTVTNDLPHFTFLGWSESDLPGLGL